MFSVCFARNQSARAFKAAHRRMKLIHRQDFFSKAMQMAHKPKRRKNTVRFWGFEFGIPRENHQRMNALIGNEVEKAAHYLDMLEILANRVLELIADLIDHLRPLCRISIGKYPTCVMLCLDDKHPIPRQQHMVDLSSAVTAWQGQVVHEVKFLAGKLASQQLTDSTLASVFESHASKTANEVSRSEKARNKGEFEQKHAAPRLWQLEAVRPQKVRSEARLRDEFAANP